MWLEIHSRRPTLLPAALDSLVLILLVAGLGVFSGCGGGAGSRTTNSIGMEFSLIPAGEFLAGSSAEEPGHKAREKQRKVNFKKKFYISVTEVTQAQYEQIMGENPSVHRGPKYPVERVSWEDALSFCRRLSEKDGHTYRLPTSDEWEYACRAGSTTAFAFGDSLTAAQANFDGGQQAYGTENSANRGETVAVGSFSANDWGLRDMHGNVAEWCLDLYPGAAEYHVVRGGSFSSAAVNCRSASRLGWVGVHQPTIGFRVLRSADPEEDFKPWTTEDTLGDDVLRELDAALVEETRQLKPGVLIFPAFIKPNEMETKAMAGDARLYTYDTLVLTSYTAMARAAYGPQKMMDVSPLFVRDLFDREGFWDRGGVRFDEATIRGCLAASGLTMYVVPVIQRRDEGRDKRSSTLELQFHGDGKDFADKTYRHTLPFSQFHDQLQDVIVEDVRNYLGIPMAESDKNLAGKKPLREELYGGLPSYLRRPSLWTGIDDREPKPFEYHQWDIAWEAYLRAAPDREQAYQQFAGFQTHHPSHWLELLAARHLRATGRFRQALDKLVKLAPTHQSDPYFQQEFLLLAIQLAKPELAQKLLERWEKNDSSYAGHLLRGEVLLDWALEARGTALADQVTEEDATANRQRMAAAKAAFEAAAAKYPDDSVAHARLITVAQQLSLPRAAMEGYFEKAMRCKRVQSAACSAKFAYLLPRWHGTPDDLLEFGADCAASDRWDDGVPYNFVTAVRDYETGWDPEHATYKREFFSKPAVWRGVKAYFEGSRKMDAGDLEEPMATVTDRIGSQALLWGCFAEHEKDLMPVLSSITHPDLAVISDYALFFHLRDRVEAAAAANERQSLAQIRVALAAGKYDAAAELLGQAKLTSKYAQNHVVRLRKALEQARSFEQEGKLDLAAADILSAWPMFEQHPGQPADESTPSWSLEGEYVLCQVPAYSNACIVCPFPLGKVEISGSLKRPETARLVQLITHTKADMDTVHLRLEPLLKRMYLLRNAHNLNSQPLPSGDLSFTVRIEGQQDVYKVNGATTMTIETPKAVPGGIAFEVHSRNREAIARVGPLSIRKLPEASP